MLEMKHDYQLKFHIVKINNKKIVLWKLQKGYSKRFELGLLGHNFVILTATSPSSNINWFKSLL
jgi:hypothetical protein